jgi:hypothetical protein
MKIRALHMRVSNTRKRETRVVGERFTFCPHTKISGPDSLSPHLAKFLSHAPSCSAVTLEITAPPPPPAVLDLGPRARCRLDPGIRACRRHPLPQALGHCHAVAVDLDSASLRERCRHRPRPHLPLSTLPPLSSTPTSLSIKP